MHVHPCGQSGYGFRGICLKQGIDFIMLSQTEYLFLTNVLNRVWFWVECLNPGLLSKSVRFFFLSRVRPHLPTQGYIKYPPPPGGWPQYYTQTGPTTPFREGGVFSNPPPPPLPHQKSMVSLFNSPLSLPVKNK